MAIAASKYVSITSAIGGTGGAAQRDLIGRLFTTNELVPTSDVLEFTTLTDVGEYFGTSSVEYLRAQFYFGWVSKQITSARKISFARWADVATAPQIFGVEATYALATFTGDFGLSRAITVYPRIIAPASPNSALPTSRNSSASAA